MLSKSQKIQHLYNRAAFGMSVDQFQAAQKSRLKTELKNLMGNSVGELPLTAIAENPFVRLREDWKDKSFDREGLKKELNKRIKESRVKLRDLNTQWMEQLTNPQAMVREKLTLFWHDHFAVRSNNGYHAQLHNNVLRKHALGKYRDLLLAVAKDPAMLAFLNNQQNNKRKPNENFARELLELYTLGRGHYTEKDIKEAARAFTGWKFDRYTCQFRFISRQHDAGEKEFMGKTGDFDGENIIDMVLANKQTAYYLSAKLFQYYVSDQPDEPIIRKMADRFYKSDYDIEDLLTYVFSAEWFYEERFIHNKIKSPQELLHGIRQHFGLSYEMPRALIFLQKSLGQQLFFPPSVNGWSVGREWVNSSSLVNRMRLVNHLARNADLEIRVKDELDDQGKSSVRGAQLLKTGRMNWSLLETHLSGMGDEQKLDTLIEFLISKPLNANTKRALLSELKKQEDDAVRWLAVTIAGLPEYQLA